MLNFTNYLNEAKISSGKVEAVLDIFIRLLEKKTGTIFHRYGGPKGVVQNARGDGYLYIGRNKTAVRFNYANGEFTSVTYWKSFKLGKRGDYTIDLGGIGLLQAGRKLIELVADPKIGSFGVYANPELKESYITEAKRSTPEEFFSLASNALPTGVSISSMTWDDISDVAVTIDRQVPSVVKNLKVGKGRNARYDLTRLVSSNAVSDPVGKKSSAEKDYYIKITAQDKNTRAFVSVKGDRVAQDMLNQIRGTINNPDVKEEMKDPNSLFGIMKNLVQLVCRKSRNSLLIYGGPGTGKTYTVTQTLANEGMVKNKDWYVIKGKITTAALYQNLFLHRKGGILLFDDTDSIWGDAEAANILKAALDSYDERVISWFSARTINVSKMTEDEKEDMNTTIETKMMTDPMAPIKLPSEFLFNGRIIFISNLPREKFDTAVLTRSAKIDMTLTDAQMFHRIESILDKLGDENVPIDAKKEILEFLKAKNMAGLLREPSMRTFVAAEDLYKSGLPNWRELLDYV